MAGQLNFKNCTYPKDWDDDTRMNFLFSIFREKSANPEGWDAKMHFWTTFILDICHQSETLVFTHNTLCSALERKGRPPQCLDLVLSTMKRDGLLMNVNEFIKVIPEKGWLGWSFDVFIQKPVSWGFSTLQSFLKSSKTDDDERLIVLPVVKELSAKVLKHCEESGANHVGRLVTMKTLEKECSSVCSGPNFELVIMQLQKDGHLTVFDEGAGKKIIKFLKIGEKKLQGLTAIDNSILKLQHAQELILSEIYNLEEDIAKCTEEAKQLAKAGNKSKALFTLKRRKRIEALVQQKAKELDNLEHLYSQVQDMGSNTVILEAFRSVSLAMKSFIKTDLNFDKVDNVMSDVGEVLDDYAEVQSTISKPASSADEGLEAFEDELNEILAAEENSKRTKMKRPSPSIVTDEDLLRRLAALKTPPAGAPPVKKAAVTEPLCN